jgi:hypothetical protein
VAKQQLKNKRTLFAERRGENGFTTFRETPRSPNNNGSCSKPWFMLVFILKPMVFGWLVGWLVGWLIGWLL